MDLTSDSALILKSLEGISILILKISSQIWDPVASQHLEGWEKNLDSGKNERI